MTARTWVAGVVLVGGALGLLLYPVGVGWAGLGVVTVALLAGSWTGAVSRRLRRQVRVLASGETVHSMASIPIAELSEVSDALRATSERAEMQRRDAEQVQRELQGLLDAMSEGVIELDGEARLLRANEAARRILELREPRGLAPVADLVRDSVLRRAIEEALGQAPESVEVTPWDRTILVRATPSGSEGTIVTVQDLTEMRRLERVRTDFVANASHELKTPLTVLRGFAETLLEEEPPPEIRKTFIASIGRHALRLQHLLEDLLDLTRLESGGWRAEREHVDIARVARRCWEDALVGQVRDVRFEVDGEGEAWADERGVEQIFTNLFSNALRYTEDGGRVTVRIRPGRERIEVAVTDTGSGIPTSALPRIFERFYRVDPARSREEGGTGLGLSIVAHLVRTMGGAVGAASAPGEGTTITFTLPHADAQEDTDVGTAAETLP